jgi:hypothetical protein
MLEPLRPCAVLQGPIRRRCDQSFCALQVANHAEHIYARINASTRAAAGAFSMQHGLLPVEGLLDRPLA